MSEMTFGKSISTCFAKYADFKGRAARPEYWWFILFTTLISWGATLVGGGIGSGLWSLIVLLPSFAAATRRLHDTGRSGWWQLLYFTIIGGIFVIVWLASKGAEEANAYGEPIPAAV